MRYSEKRIAVTGTGIISAIGKNTAEFCEAIRAGKSGIGRIPVEAGDDFPIKIGAWIKEFSFERMLAEHQDLVPEIADKIKRCARRAAFPVQCNVLAAFEAWKSAELLDKRLVAERIGLIVAGSNLGLNAAYKHNLKFQSAPEYISPNYAMNFMDTDHVGVISEIFGIKGEGFTLGDASASGNAGIIKGFQMIKSGVADACLVVGSLTDLSPVEFMGLRNAGAIGGINERENPETACCPFDERHEGFIYGQASACLLLESYESAGKRDVPVLAEIIGGSIMLDGSRMSSPSEAGEANVMRSAMKQAGIRPEQVDYINTHGTSTPLGDHTEIMAIKDVFCEHLPNMWVNSTKGMTGHCLFASGVAEAIATVIQMREDFVHPNRNLLQPIDRECRFVGSIAEQADICIALSNGFGFGGINTCIVIKKEVR